MNPSLEYSDLKITYVEHLSVISYLTKSIEDVLIRRARVFALPLLLVDLPLLFAVLLVNAERAIYTSTVDFLIAHIKVDIRPFLRRFRNFIPEKYKERLLGGEEDERDEVTEETFAGKLFQYTRLILQFVWALFIFALFMPIWPIVFLYNVFIEFLIVGVLYYALIFFNFPGWIGGFAYYLIFCTVTFLVASISVPFILRIFIYIKYLFSLEKKSWRAINNEAKAAFLNFYLRIQKNRLKLLEKIESRYQKERVAEGGIYYLFLKIVHQLKDYILDLRKRNVSDLFEKVEGKILSMHAQIYQEKREYDEAIFQMPRAEIIKTFVALVITFLFSGWLAMAGLHGHNLLASIFLSFLDSGFATTAWWNYKASGMGYYEYVANFYTFIPGFVKIIASGVDYFWGYFFRAYYYILPIYIAFIHGYYQYFGRLFTRLF